MTTTTTTTPTAPASVASPRVVSTRSDRAADGDWTARAACTVRPDLPWTTDTTALPPRTATRSVTAMTRVCGTCPVRTACAAHAEQITATGGFWAGADRSITQLPLFPDLVSADVPAAPAGGRR